MPADLPALFEQERRAAADRRCGVLGVRPEPVLEGEDRQVQFIGHGLDSPRSSGAGLGQRLLFEFGAVPCLLLLVRAPLESLRCGSPAFYRR